MASGNAGVLSDLPLAAGTALRIELPNVDDAVPARVARSGNGVLALVFGQDPAVQVRLAKTIAALGGLRSAA